MILMLIKANVYSFIYLAFVIKYMRVTSKLILLQKLTRMICLIMLLQYFLYLTNMISNLSPMKLPAQFNNYPIVHHQENYAGPYLIPLLYQTKHFHDLKFAYLLGLPVSKYQMNELLLDFVLLFLVSNYVFLYQSPVLDPIVKKVFFCFPTMFESKEKWKRVAHVEKKVNRYGASGSGQQNDSAADDDEKNESKKESQDEVGYYDHVQSQVQWLRDPYLPPKKKFLEKGYTEEDFKLAYKQFAFACDYSNRNNPLDHEFDEEMDYMHEQAEEDKQDANAKQNEKALSDIDSVNSSILGEQKAPRHYYSEIGSKQLAEVCERNLNYYFINYCELKFNEIWSDDNLRERKWEMKQRDFYFRLVKQGSMLVYLTSHIFVLFVILLMATIRQSIIGFIYIGFITYCFLRTKSYAGAVLTQRENNQRQLYSNASEEHKKLKEEYQKYQNDLNQKKIKNYEIVQIMKKIQRLTPRIKQLEKQLKKYKTNIKDQKGNYESQEASEQWGIKDLIGKYLLFISTIDLTATVIFQLPTIRGSSIRRGLGLMKIWKLPDASIEYPFTYEGMVRASLTQHINGFRFESVHFWTLLITCFMIVLITFQTEIYNSTGYLKFVTQTDGSMDLLVSLSKLKQKGLAYMKNNSKIKKILQIQQKKKQLIATIDRFKAKLKRWRLFQKTTMDPMYGQNASAEDYAAGMKINDQPFSTPKNSKMRGRLLTGQKDDDEDEDEQVKFWKKLHQKKNKVSREEAEKIFENLADEFVKSKKSKLNRCARCYLCLNKCCVNNIMLKNDKATLEEIVKSQAEGSTETPSELEKIMKSEAKYMVRKFYDKQSGNQELYLLLKKSQMMGSKHSILSLTKFDKKIKLTQLESTWAFTRYSSMLMKYIELFFYIPITNTDTFIYIFMMYSMYQNAGLMSIIYPISIFGYALIEETRPGKRFWDFIRIYTMFILLLKMFFNLSWLNSFIRTDTFKYFHGMVRLGLEEQESTWDIIIYMMPEMLIISFIMVNEIMLRLNGVYDRNEIVFETVYDSIERWKAGGDEEKQREALKQQQHMDMAKYFTTYDDQKELIDQLENEQKLLEANTLYQDDEEEEKDKLTSEEQMELILKEYSTQIDMGANNFDLDGTGAESKNSFFDKMIQSKLLNKALENDTLYYFEGQRYICKKNKETFDPVEINEELEDNAIHETVSEGEHEADMDEKIELHLSHEEKTKPDIFERSQYLQTVFPSLKIQKPGYDYYGLTTFVLMILSIFVLIGFDKVNVSQADVLGKVGSQGDIFTTQTSLALLLTMMLIILERYINRANVMKAEDQPMNKIQDIKQGAQQAFQQQLRTRSMTTSMTMSQTQTMKTMKTTDFNASQSDSKALLDRMFGDEDDEHNEEITQERTKINDKQKLKFIVHWTLMISVHLAIFWIIPIRGNKTLYNGLPYCEPRDKKQFPYGCKNFHDNLYLKIFYFLFCCYFTLSGLQIRYGLPIWKKASSICHYMDYDSWEGQLCFIGAQLYSAIPFAIELRCLFDFVFTKTALDVFQFWQLFNYQFELYKAHFGNQSYVIKVMGVPITTEDYILGVFFLIIIIVMIIGPFYFFSEFSTFSTENPVRSASITVSLIVNKTLSIKDLVDRMVPKQNAPPLKDPYIDIDPIDETYRRKIQGQNESTNLFIDKNHKELFEEPNLNTSVPFDVYTVENPNMRFSPKDQDYSKWTETKFFKPTQMQEVISTEYPDKKWTIDHLNRDFLQIDINNTIIRQKPGFSISLEVKSDFVRDNPPQAKVSQNLQFKSLNYSQLDDCITGQQLLKFANFDCSDPKHDINDKVLIPWTQAYNQYLILGQTSTSVPIIRKVFEVQGEINSTTENGTTYWKEPWIVQNETLVDMNQKFDLLMEFRCPNIWLIRMSKKHTEFQDWEMDQDLRAVDPTTCVPLTRNQTYLDYLDFKGELIGHLGSDGKLVPNKNYKAKQDDQTRWTRLQFVLFSMLVSSGFFASYTVGAFYTVFLYGISPMVRLNLICPTFTAFLYDLTDATMMMKLFEACYMYRHEQDLYHEEETYRMIQEIIRSPGLFKLLTGTNLRGSIDPKNDFLNAEMIAKIKRLELLQQKGFDISAIQEKILRDNEEKMMEITKNEKKKNKK